MDSGTLHHRERGDHGSAGGPDREPALSTSRGQRGLFIIAGISIVAMLITIGVFVRDQADRNMRDEQAKRAGIEHDYDLCLQANDGRAYQRALLDFVANPNPVSPSAIQDAELRVVLIGLQARASEFRSQHGGEIQARDCTGERTQALQDNGLG